MDGPCTKCVFPLEKDQLERWTVGCTSLIQAARNGHVDCVNAWVEVGADVNTSDINGATGSDFCCWE